MVVVVHAPQSQTGRDATTSSQFGPRDMLCPFFKSQRRRIDTGLFSINQRTVLLSQKKNRVDRQQVLRVVTCIMHPAFAGRHQVGLK